MLEKTQQIQCNFGYLLRSSSKSNLGYEISFQLIYLLSRLIQDFLTKDFFQFIYLPQPPKVGFFKKQSKKMLKSRSHFRLLSLNQSKNNSQQNSKKYRCDCCKDKKHIDYNRENRLKRESASSKRLNFTQRESNRYASVENNINIPNTHLIYSIEDYQVKARQESDKKKLSAIFQSPHLVQQQNKEDKNSSTKSPIVDMKSFCKTLFSNSRKKKPIYRIEVQLNGQKYEIEFDEGQRMRLALGQLKLLIKNCQNPIRKINYSIKA